MQNNKLVERLEKLLEKCPEKWEHIKEPHGYPDGTNHFDHIVYTAKDSAGELSIVEVEVGSYLGEDFVELLLLLKNNLPEIIEALKK